MPEALKMRRKPGRRIKFEDTPMLNWSLDPKGPLRRKTLKDL
jgi:hypothetical protein